MCEKKRKGFTLIEMFIAMVLVLLAILSATRMLSVALKSYRNSKQAFRMLQQLESVKNGFLAFPFDSEHWAAGDYTEDGAVFKKDWRIKNISSSLKIIHLSLLDKRTEKKQKTWFYKSSTINNYSKENRGNHD